MLQRFNIQMKWQTLIYTNSLGYMQSSTNDIQAIWKDNSKIHFQIKFS